MSHLRDLSPSQADRFNVPAAMLFSYWNSFSYDFGREEQKGLLAFYGYAAEIGAIEAGNGAAVLDKRVSDC